jgi:plastocyanin
MRAAAPATVVRVGILTTVVVAFAACSSSSGSSTSGSSAPVSASGSVAGTAVMVTETEFTIKLSRTHFTPGVYTFVTRDSGSITHALEIDGPGVHDKASSNINPGQSTQLTVMLRKGTYDVWCPIANHKQLGMNTSITVS